MAIPRYLNPKTPYTGASLPHRGKHPDLFFDMILMAVGLLLLVLVILLKSHTATDFNADPLILFYTVFVTTFELSRILAALFYHSTHKETMKTSKFFLFYDVKKSQ